MHRRAFLTQSGAALTLASGLVAASRPRVLAQATPPALASPIAIPASLAAYPRATVTIDDHAVTGPAGLTAGLTLVTVENRMSAANGPEHMIWGKLPSDVTADQAKAIFAAEPGPGTPPAATPDPGNALLDRTTIVGGPDFAAPGGSAVGLVNFTAGSYFLLNVFGGQSGAFMVGPAAANAVTTPPQADVTIKLHEMVIDGLDAAIPAGTHIWSVANTGAMPHELDLAPVDAGTTAQQFLTAISQPNAPFRPIPGNSILSPGQQAWQLLTLAAGTYAAACFVPFQWSGQPHAFMGMVKIFTVA